MYLGIDIHKRYAQVAVLNEDGELEREVRVENANLEELAEEYAGSQAVIEATSNSYHIYDTLSEYVDVTVAHPGKLTLIAQSDKKTDRVDAKELARLLRLGSVPESHVPSEAVRGFLGSRLQTFSHSLRFGTETGFIYSDTIVRS